MTLPEFVGASCGLHGACTFYKAFKYVKDGKCKILTLGEFFFVRLSAEEDPCIGELQLLWEDKNSEQVLSSSRLYFLPEQTPEGRQLSHGEHEILAASEKVVLRLEDLVSWITDEVEWVHGLQATYDDQSHDPPNLEVPTPETPLTEGVDLRKAFLETPSGIDIKDVIKERELEEKENEDKPAVRILSFPRYCRYRGVLRRLEGLSDGWLRHVLLVALGGFTLPSKRTYILFCKETFHHDALTQNDSILEHLAPNLKAKSKKKKKSKRNNSPSSESSAGEEHKVVVKKVSPKKNGIKKRTPEEQDFLQKLFKFMKTKSTPISRVPHLGFKQIDLYLFYNYAQKLGGYDKITTKRLWKKVYDEMGGNPGSTSAATCTRRHYERLLLPFERHLRGEDHMPMPSSKVKIKSKHSKLQNSNGELIKKEPKEGKENSSIDNDFEEVKIKKEPLDENIDNDSNDKEDLMPLTKLSEEILNRKKILEQKNKLGIPVNNRLSLLASGLSQLEPVTPPQPRSPASPAHNSSSVSILSKKIGHVSAVGRNSVSPVPLCFAASADQAISSLAKVDTSPSPVNSLSGMFCAASAPFPFAAAPFLSLSQVTAASSSSGATSIVQGMAPSTKSLKKVDALLDELAKKQINKPGAVPYTYSRMASEVSYSKENIKPSSSVPLKHSAVFSEQNPAYKNKYINPKDSSLPRPSVIQHTEKMSSSSESSSPVSVHSPLPSPYSTLPINSSLRRDAPFPLVKSPYQLPGFIPNRKLDLHSRSSHTNSVKLPTPNDKMYGLPVAGLNMPSTFKHHYDGKSTSLPDMKGKNSYSDNQSLSKNTSLGIQRHSSHSSYPNSSNSVQSYRHSKSENQNYETEVLDLSVKKRPADNGIVNNHQEKPHQRLPSTSSTSVGCIPQDLSVKKVKTEPTNGTRDYLYHSSKYLSHQVHPKLKNSELSSYMSKQDSKAWHSQQGKLKSAPIEQDDEVMIIKVKNDAKPVANAYLPRDNKVYLPGLGSSKSSSSNGSSTPSKPALVSDYNPSLPTFITPPFYPFGGTWPPTPAAQMAPFMSPDFTALKELAEHVPFNSQFNFPISPHIYPLLYPQFSK